MLTNLMEYQIIQSEDRTEELESSLLNKNQPSFPVAEKSLRDRKFLILIVVFFILMTALTWESLSRGDPTKFLNEYDSWGNVCGRKNNPAIPGVNLSGIDHSNRSYVFFTSVNNIRPVLKPHVLLRSDQHSAAVLCIKKCPTAEITDCREMLLENGYRLPDELIKKEVCVMLFDIIFPQTVDLNRCIPTKFLQVIAYMPISKYVFVT